MTLAPHHREHIEFRFSANNLSGGNARIRYQYRLEGLDDQWLDAGTHRRAHYTRLPPGEYRFQVRAKDEIGRWSFKPAGLTFTAAP